MAEKISTIILKVDLDCHKCYKKLRKILCSLQDQEKIRTISYDDKSSTITIVGPFDPHKLSCKIRCKGGKLIKGILIMDGAGGKPEKMPSGPPPDNKKPKVEQPAEKAQPAAEMSPPRMAELDQAPPKGKPIDLPVVSSVEIKKPTVRLPPPPACKPDRRPHDVTPTMAEIPSWPAPPVVAVGQTGACGCSCCTPDPRPHDVTPTMAEIPSWPAPPVVAVGQTGACGCSCCTPCYQGYYERCRCCHGGRVYGHAAGPPAGCYCGAGAPYCDAYRGCRLVIEEDPTACSIM